MNKGNVLLVDDQPENIGVLYTLLQEDGYEVYIANDGESALESLEEIEPDLILLDVMMPGLNGFEVSERLQANPRTQKIPVIFMTALTDNESKLKGFSVGGVDYITKPFEHTEVRARIQTQLTMYQLRRELEEKNLELQDKNQELDAFSHTVAHDLKSPLHIIVGFSEVITTKCAPSLEEEDLSMLKSISSSAAKAADIIESLLLLAGTSRHQRLYLEPFDMRFIIPKVLKRIEPLIQEYGGELQVPDAWLTACGFPPWVEEIWVNYLSNALKYGGNPPQIAIGCAPRDNFVRFWVKDNGPGLSVEEQQKLFTPFTRLHRDRAEGHGLGLSIVERIISKLNGQAGIESTLGQGSLFYFELPTQYSSAQEP